MTYLATDHDGAWGEVHVGVGLEAVVHDNDVQTVHQLPLVLVDTLHLHVEDG